MSDARSWECGGIQGFKYLGVLWAKQVQALN